MDYNFREIEKKWQKRWVDNQTYKVKEDENKKKFYVLNMFPYPSGAGLHVGHPLGYIASDIYARYKRLQGFNVLNPMGYDAYGLPAEQYAIQTGQHPAITTVNNINRYRSQLDKIGFCFDWDREVRTCDPIYYKWTQWAFQKMFESFYCNKYQMAQPISELVKHFETKGTEGLDVACTEEISFTAAEWNAKSEKEKQETLMNYRIAYLGETMVNWCPKLGTVLANDEVVEGLSVRGGYPVEQKKMRQWCLRTSAYAQRLLDGLDVIDWTDSLKETQRNWIGRSEGAEVQFKVKDSDLEFTIFTTRADTMYGVTFMVLAPESELVPQVTTEAQKAEVEAYLDRTKKRTERDRIADRSVTGVFSGSYAINPFTGEAVPIWISDYVLAGYGTGAIMAVPAHDSRDYAFAKHFNLPIVPLVEGCDVSEESFDAKEGIVCNSPKSGVEPYCDLNLNGLTIKEAIAATKKYVKEHHLGRVKVNYRLRDAIFSRQRYWGEPFPVYYKDGMPYMIPAECLPLELPEIDEYKPTETGEPPLGRATKWAWDEVNKQVVENTKIDNKTTTQSLMYSTLGTYNDKQTALTLAAGISSYTLASKITSVDGSATNGVTINGIASANLVIGGKGSDVLRGGAGAEGRFRIGALRQHEDDRFKLAALTFMHRTGIGELQIAHAVAVVGRDAVVEGDGQQLAAVFLHDLHGALALSLYLFPDALVGDGQDHLILFGKRHAQQIIDIIVLVLDVGSETLELDLLGGLA